MPSRFGRQPAADALRRERWSIPLAARQIDVPENHLRTAVGGYNRPMPEVRERLPKLLGLPLEELFTPEVLARPYCPGRNVWKPVQR
ncbi:hypothetical protein [Micromonospora sp. 4G55]|uniref:hypothetical protein n=1 Tax=Micromonospora sp. 4G55 TaxID=2806102 RepID=UPI001A4FB827|nr:hypothetical protein [Micromonospora sp. 4G55]MBM0258956.1 hypothetical protein [Micromonospora sp. 4G55]